MSKNDEEKAKCRVEDISARKMENLKRSFNNLGPGDSSLTSSKDGTLVIIERPDQLPDYSNPDIVIYRDPAGNELVVHVNGLFDGNNLLAPWITLYSYHPKSDPVSKEQETEDEDN